MNLDRKRVLKPVRKLRKLVRNLDEQPAPGKVHHLRTNARRIEAMFEALPADARGLGKSFMKDVRRCRKRAGKVRDMDVLTGYASTVHPEGEEECAVRLLEHLGAERQKYAKKLCTEVRRVRSGLSKDLKRTAARLNELIQEDGSGPNRTAREAGAVASHAAGWAASFALGLAAPHRLNRGNLHPYRLKIKELRNVLQMASGDTPFTDDLGEVKDAIGEWHDWQQLVSIAAEELDHGRGCRLLAELKRISLEKYDHALASALALRKTYLRNSDSGKHSSSAVTAATPRLPVWDAIAKLAS